MKTKLQIRQATADDATRLSQLICENADTILRPHYSEAQWYVFLKYYSPQAMAEKIMRQTIFCAEKKAMVVGCIGLEHDFVVGFYTRLQNRNQGIGKLLMDHLVMHARIAGLKTLQLAASPEGLSFYYNNGWEKLRDVVVDHYGVGFQETLMVKKL